MIAKRTCGRVGGYDWCLAHFQYLIKGTFRRMRDINHIVDLIGIDHVGIGSDFDGDGELIGCSATNELINITVRLLEEGYTEEDIRKIWGGNLLRVMTAIQDFPNK